MLRIILISFLSLLLINCATVRNGKPITTKQLSLLSQGQRYFEEGYYRRAMQELLPLACEGVPDAQYAVGYMYYYGNGVAQDTEVGYFWIKRSADQGYEPAKKALVIIERDNEKKPVKKLKPPPTSPNAVYY